VQNLEHGRKLAGMYRSFYSPKEWTCFMPKTSAGHARIEPELKNETEEVFRHTGLSVTQAITLFYKQVQLRRSLPFDVVISNDATFKTSEDTDAGRSLTVCEDVKDMFNKLAI